MPSSPSTKALSLSLTVLLVAGCSMLPDSDEASKGGEGKPQHQSSPSASDPLAERLHLPVYDYIVPAEDRRVLENARAVVAEECMADLGYDYTHGSGGPEDLEIYDEFFGPHDEYRRYGISSRETANTYAYNIPAVVADENFVPAEFGHSGATLQDAKDALRGNRTDISTPSGEPVPQGGCSSWSERQFTGQGAGEKPVPFDSSLTAEDIKRRSFDQSLTDSRVLKVFEKWSSCMADNGYQAEDPLDTMDNDIGTGKATQEQSTMTVADLDCKEKVGLIDTWLEVETEIQKELIAEKEAILLEDRKRMEDSLEYATEVLES